MEFSEFRCFALLCEEFNAEFRAPSCEVQRRTSHSLVLTFSLEFALFTVNVHVESLWIPRGVHGVSADFGVNSVRSPHMEIWKSGIPAGFRIEKWKFQLGSTWKVRRVRIPQQKCGIPAGECELHVSTWTKMWIRIAGYPDIRFLTHSWCYLVPSYWLS